VEKTVERFSKDLLNIILQGVVKTFEMISEPGNTLVRFLDCE